MQRGARGNCPRCPPYSGPVCREISAEQCLKRIPDLVRSKTVLLIDLEETTHVPRLDSDEKLNDDHISNRSLCIYTYMKNLFIAEATIQKQNVNERHLPRHYSILVSSAGCREKQSHNRMIDSHWALEHIALKYV